MSLILSGSDGVSDIDGSASTPAIRGTDTNTGIFFPAADTIGFAEGGAEAMRIDSSGNVGIGNSTARARLTVSDGTLNTAGEAVYQGYIVGADRSGLTEGNLAIQSNDAMAIDKGGSISFGGRAVSASDAGANWARIAGRKENGTTAEYGGYLQFATRPNSGAMLERGRFTSGGYFKASNTGTYDSTTTSKHELVSSTTNNEVVLIKHTAVSSPYGIAVTFSGAAPNNTTEYFLNCEDTANQKAVIHSSGTISNRTGTYNTISDLKFKQDITNASSQWDDIKAMRIVKYRLKDEVAADPNYPAYIGVIAQEVEQVSPGLIDNCVDKDSGEVTKSVKSSIIYMKAVKALQEAMARIETLEAQNAAFETRLAALENK